MLNTIPWSLLELSMAPIAPRGNDDGFDISLVDSDPTYAAPVGVLWLGQATSKMITAGVLVSWH